MRLLGFSHIMDFSKISTNSAFVNGEISILSCTEKWEEKEKEREKEK